MHRSTVVRIASVPRKAKLFCTINKLWLGMRNGTASPVSLTDKDAQKEDAIDTD